MFSLLSIGIAPVLAMLCPLIYSFANPLSALCFDWIILVFSRGQRMTMVVKDETMTMCILDHFKTNKNDYTWLHEIIVDGHTTVSGHVFSWKHKVWTYIEHAKSSSSNGSEGVSVQITLYYISKQKFKEFTEEIKRDDTQTIKDKPVEIKTVDMLMRTGGSYNYYYIIMKVPIFYTEMPAQTAAIDFILKEYNANHRRLSVFIYGIPGTGKSWMTILLALRMNAFYCKKFNPNNQGDQLVPLISRNKPTKEKPLVINHNEVNELIDICHSFKPGTSNSSGSVPLCYNKQTFNDYCDDFELMPENIILCGTSNDTPAQINSLCPSYLRGGRFHIIIEFLSCDTVKITKQLKPNLFTEHVFGDENYIGTCTPDRDSESD